MHHSHRFDVPVLLYLYSIDWRQPSVRKQSRPSKARPYENQQTMILESNCYDNLLNNFCLVTGDLCEISNIFSSLKRLRNYVIYFCSHMLYVCYNASYLLRLDSFLWLHQITNIYLPRTLEQNVTSWGGHTLPFVILDYEASKPSFLSMRHGYLFYRHFLMIFLWVLSPPIYSTTHLLMS